MIKHFPNGQEIATGYFDIGYLNNIVTKTLFFPTLSGHLSMKL